MSDQFLGEVRMFGCNFAPVGWALCNGQIMSISQNTALFSLLGTNYGGNGTSTFALPNLQGNAALDAGQGPGLTQRLVGETGGAQSVTLTISQMPAHNHQVNAKAPGTATDPNGLLWANPGGKPAPNFFANAIGTAQPMNATALATVGGNQPHDNMMPYQVINFCIALQGIFPARN